MENKKLKIEFYEFGGILLIVNYKKEKLIKIEDEDYCNLIEIEDISELENYNLDLFDLITREEAIDVINDRIADNLLTIDVMENRCENLKSIIKELK